MQDKIRPIDIAKRLKISTSSLRNYEARGLVPPPQRLSTGYRIYTKEHVAYFECIAAMSPGFGMDITTDVLKKIQLKELNSALWILNKAQVNNYEDKVFTEKAMRLIEKSADEQIFEKHLTIGEVSEETKVTTTTLRYWESEGLVHSIRNEENNYRLYDMFELIKIMLMKTTQNSVYSHEIIQLKQDIKNLKKHDFQGLKMIVLETHKNLNKRNQQQLFGLHKLYRLCETVNLYS
ncbi:MerR family DNA-binding transcriptional regulator [Metabacillus bambusae]|uniref:MerR family DNA-binding transcriptional regulator n=1 Tax=Metabacillus bambusae TaxID=2795218 RepID=A0ABS3N1Z6_9BACI|nr:MerR family DNA-binding transcriptional regulator [Metabacillus bambusae]MBO1511943.1 MerR family DNA-binding transcriptional regulator [Metabacillus bambusae]